MGSSDNRSSSIYREGSMSIADEMELSRLYGVGNELDLDRLSGQFAVAEADLSIRQERLDNAGNAVTRLFHYFRVRSAQNVVSDLFAKGEDLDYRLTH